jgi:hypothetical protein
VKQAIRNKVFSFVVILAGSTIGFQAAHAEDIQDMFLYQANAGGSQSDFIRSNVEGLFQGQKMQKKISDQFSVDVLQLKTMHKELDSSHQFTLESTTAVDVHFAQQWFSRVQLGNTREDIDDFNQFSKTDSDQQRTYSLSQGWKGTIGDVQTETFVGVVKCVNGTDEKYYPVASFKMGKTFDSNAQLSLQAAQEIQEGGSYTGIYGNQVFRKMMAVGRIPLFKKLSFLWDAGIGVSQTSFEEENHTSIRAGVATMSASLEYEIGTHVKGTLGYSNRKFVDMNTGSTNAEGHMMSASLAIANF